MRETSPEPTSSGGPRSNDAWTRAEAARTSEPAVAPRRRATSASAPATSVNAAPTAERSTGAPKRPLASVCAARTRSPVHATTALPWPVSARSSDADLMLGAEPLERCAARGSARRRRAAPRPRRSRARGRRPRWRAARPTRRRRGRSSRPRCATWRRTWRRSAASAAGPKPAPGAPQPRPDLPARVPRHQHVAARADRDRHAAHPAGGEPERRAERRALRAAARRRRGRRTRTVLEPREREVAARVAGEARRRDPRALHDAPGLPERAGRTPERDPQLRARGSRLEPTGRDQSRPPHASGRRARCPRSGRAAREPRGPRSGNRISRARGGRTRPSTNASAPTPSCSCQPIRPAPLRTKASDMSSMKVRGRETSRGADHGGAAAAGAASTSSTSRARRTRRIDPATVGAAAEVAQNRRSDGGGGSSASSPGGRRPARRLGRRRPPTRGRSRSTSVTAVARAGGGRRRARARRRSGALPVDLVGGRVRRLGPVRGAHARARGDQRAGGQQRDEDPPLDADRRARRRRCRACRTAARRAAAAPSRRPA